MKAQNPTPGQSFSREWYIDRYQPVRFAAALQDFTPTYIDTRLAELLRLPGLPLQETCLVAIFESFLLDSFAFPVKLDEVSLRFITPVFAPGPIVLRFRIDKLEQERMFLILEGQCPEHDAPFAGGTAVCQRVLVE